MSMDEMDRPFDSIESAHEFMTVLAETVLDAMKELHLERQVAVREGEGRRGQAIELAQFKLKTLNCHLYKSRRILNDLRMIRRLILSERETVERAMAAM
jgi:hypothetical protein